MKFPLLAKAAALGAVFIALAGSLGIINGIVSERDGRLREAQRSVADGLAASQTLLGPVLQRDCVERWSSLQGEGSERKRVDEQRRFALHAMPRSLRVDAVAATEVRQRGIFRINGYAVAATLDAEWSELASLQPQRQHEGSSVSCADPVLWVAVGDTRGIRQARVTLQGVEAAVLPGTPAQAAPSGFHAPWPGLLATAGTVRASVQLDLVGTADLAFVPIGDSTQVALRSDWPHPSFNGRFLPATRQVTDQGFVADWQVSALASQAARQWRDGHLHCPPQPALAAAGKGCVETFGVSFIDPVSTYVLSDRATKYGLLFIALTFVAVALVEVLRQLRVHPIQYLLVGAALSVFFLLLVSLGEHLGFHRAYLIASAACTLLLAYYGMHVLRGWRAGALFGLAIGLLYATLYVLLLQEQTALMLGAVLLFAVLASVMVVTRQLDWYALLDQMSGARPAARRLGGLSALGTMSTLGTLSDRALPYGRRSMKLGCRGSVSVASAPPSGWLVRSALPPCSAATSRTKARPSPVLLRPPSGRGSE